MSKSGVRYAALLTAMLPMLAGYAAETGVWLGSGWDGPVPHAVRLQLDAGGGDLRLGSPLACRVPLKRDRDVHVVGVSTAGGAACDRMVGRKLTVRADGRGLRVEGLSASTLALRPSGDAAVASDARTLSLVEAGAGPVELRFVAAGLGQRSGEWRQGAPASCRIALELAAVESGRQWHVFTAASTGGRCDRLVGGTIALPVVPGRTAAVRDGNGRDVVLAPQ